MQRSLAIFRGLQRLEYRNQAIKLLRAIEGEHTRSSYRDLWVQDEVLEVLTAESNPIATAVFVDPSGTLAFPARQLMVVDHRIDEETKSLNLTFEVGPFVATRLDFTSEISAWDDAADACPPKRFVSIWRDAWPGLDELPREAASGRWRESIDFLTTHWDLSESVFLRLGGIPEAEPSGPVMRTTESRKTTLTVESYNPHLRSTTLKSRSIRVFQSGGLVSIESGDRNTPNRDGTSEIQLRCFEPGDARVDINVHPDPQFSTYLPISFKVAVDPEIGTGRPHVLGREWQQCLDGLEAHLTASPDLHLSVLDLLGRVFPEDPSVLQHKGRIQYRLGDLAEARQFFDQAMTLREDAATIAWNLFAALRRGDLGDAMSLLTKLNLSHHDLFDELLEVAETLPEPVALALMRKSGEVFGDDKMTRLLARLQPNVQTEAGACELAVEIARIDPHAAISYLTDLLSENSDWTVATRTVLSIAEQGEMDEPLEEFALRALRWRNDEANDFRARWHSHQKFITTPEHRVGLALRNARDLFDAGLDELGSDLAIEAADSALEQGDLMVAQEALTLIFSNRLGGDDDDFYLDAARATESRIGEVLQELTPITPRSEEYLARLYQQLRPWTSGKTMAVLGGGARHPMADEWEAELRVRLVWLTSTPSNPVDEDRLRAFDPKGLIVIGLWESMGHLKKNTIKWLKENQVDHVWAKAGRSSVIEALVRHYPKLDESEVKP
jgi:tetratricopeptide (TPR) repeat protein